MILGSKNPPASSTALAPAQPPAPPVPESAEVEPRTPGEALYLILSEQIRKAKPSTQMELVEAFQGDVVYDEVPRKVKRLLEAAGDELVELFSEEDDEGEDDEDDDGEDDEDDDDEDDDEEDEG